MQFDFAGTIAVADGRYLARETGRGDGAQTVLVIATLGAPPLPPRRRQRPQSADENARPGQVPVSRVTAVRAFEPFASESDARHWLERAVATEAAADELVDEAMTLLNRALHTQGAASGNPYAQELSPERALAARIGYGDGEDVAFGRHLAAQEVDVRTTPGSRRRRRAADLRPQERLAAVLGGRETLAACETLVPRARADLDAGRDREAALQLRVGLEALLAEMPKAVADPGHEADIGQLRERQAGIGDAANRALLGDLDEMSRDDVGEVLEICERILRRRRVLEG